MIIDIIVLSKFAYLFNYFLDMKLKGMKARSKKLRRPELAMFTTYNKIILIWTYSLIAVNAIWLVLRCFIRKLDEMDSDVDIFDYL